MGRAREPQQRGLVMSAADRLSGSLSEAVDAFASLTQSAHLACVQIETMRRALRAARHYVEGFEPSSTSEDMRRDELLRDIDELAPPLPPPIKYCNVGDCCLREGHEGEHNAIPF